MNLVECPSNACFEIKGLPSPFQMWRKMLGIHVLHAKVINGGTTGRNRLENNNQQTTIFFTTIVCHCTRQHLSLHRLILSYAPLALQTSPSSWQCHTSTRRVRNLATTRVLVLATSTTLQKTPSHRRQKRAMTFSNKSKPCVARVCKRQDRARHSAIDAMFRRTNSHLY